MVSENVSATQTDPAGNVSVASSTLAVTIDSSTPATTGTPDMTAGTDLGSSSIDDITSDTTPTFDISCETGTTVNLIGSVTGALGSGTCAGSTVAITATTMVSENVSATQTDTAGNTSAASTTLAVTVDTSADAAPGVPNMTAGTDTGSSSIDDTTSDTTPDFAISCVTGSTVTLRNNTTSIGTGTCAAGTVTITSSALAEGGFININAIQTDTAGNVSSASANATTITIDTSADAAPGTPNMTAGTDSGSSDSDNITSDTTPTFDVSCVTGSTVNLIGSVTGALGSAVCAGSTAAITATAMVSENVSATQTDPAGNVSVASSTLAVTIDTTADAAPGAPDMTAGTDDGGSSTDNITSDPTPDFDISCVTGSSVEIFRAGSTSIGTGTCAGSTVTITSAALPVASHTITAKQTDTAGNESVASSGLSVTINASATYTVSGTVFTDEGVTNIGTGKTVRLLVNGTSAITTTTNASGEYTFSNVAISTGDIITVHIDGETEDGVTVTKFDGANVTGLAVYQNHLIINDTDDTLTLADLDTANDGDADIVAIYANGATAVVASTTEAYIAAGTTFAPGAAWDINGDLEIVATATLNMAANSLTIAGDLINNGTLTFTAGTDLVFDGGASQVFNPGSGALACDVIVSGASTVVALSTNALDIGTNDLTINNATGVFSTSGQNVTFDTLSNTGTFRVRGSETLSITTQDIDSGTWEYIGDGDTLADTFTVKDFGTPDYFNLVINSTDANDTFQAGSALSIAGTLAVQAGILDMNGNTNAVTGTTTISGGTYLAGTATQTFTGDVTVSGGTLTGGSGTLDFNGNLSESSGVLTLSSGTTNLAGNFTYTGGTFNHNSGTLLLDSSTNHTLTGNVVYNHLSLTESSNNSSDISLIFGSDFSIAGSLVLDGLDADDMINIDSTVGGVVRTITFNDPATFTGDYLDIEDLAIIETSSNITLPLAPANSTTTNSSGFGTSISGTVYTDEGVTNIGAGKTVRLLINGLAGQTTTTNASGVYTFAGVTVADGDIVTVHIDGETEDGVTVSKNDGGNMTGLSIYQNHLIISDTDDTLTLADLDTANDGDADIVAIYANGATAVVASTTEAYIAAGTTFAPGAAWDINGDLEIVATATLNMAANSLTIAGDLINNGTLTFTAGTDLVFDGGASQVFNPGSGALASDIVVSGAGTTVVLTGNALNIGSNDITIDNATGVLSLAGNNLTADVLSNTGTLRVRGSEVVTLGTMDTDSGTYEYIGDGDGNADTFIITDFGTPDYYNLKISSTDANDTYQAGAGLSIAGTLAITNGILDMNGNTNAVTGTTTISGGTYLAGTATQTFTGDVTVSGGTLTGGSGTLDFNGNLSESSGVLTLSSGTTNLAGNFTYTGGTFNHNSGSLVLDSSVSHTLTGNVVYNNLSLTESSNNSTDISFILGSDFTIAGSLTLDGLDADDMINIDSTIGGVVRTITFNDPATFTGDYLDIEDLTIVDLSSNITLPLVPANSTSSNSSGWFNSPTVTSVSASTSNGSYNAGDTVDVTVTFSESVTVTGTPQITLETGATDDVVNYTSGSPGTVLTFTYTIGAGDTSADLDYVGTTSLVLNGGTINGAGGAATLTLATPGAANSLGANKAIVVDTTADAAPGTPDMTAGTDSGSSNSDNITSDTTPTFDVSCVTGSTVNLIGSVTGALGSAVCAGSTAAITATAMVSENVSATQTDPAGNVSVASGTLAITIDTSTAAPGTPDLESSSDTGNSSTDNTTSDTTPDLTSSCETGATVNFYRGGVTLIGTGTCAGSTVTVTSAAIAEGSYTITAEQTDVAGNASIASAGLSITIDTTNGSVSSVNSVTAAGSYKAADAISIQVNFSEAVFVTGTPQLTLETGTGDAIVNYTSGTGTSTLNFNYTISSGENSADLDYVSTAALSLNGGTITDDAGNTTTLTLATPGAANSLGANEALVVDTTVPTVSGVTASTGNGSYNAGDVINVQVNFSENVTVTGTPQLTLETGAGDQVVNYSSGTSTSTLVFQYTVQSGDTSADLDYVSTAALSLNGGTILDGALNPATLTLANPGTANSLGANKALIIDTTNPTVTDVSASTVNGYYNAADVVNIEIYFDENVTVTGTPTLELETGTTDQFATYSSGTGTGTLVFQYTVQAGDTSADLDYKATNSLALSGGTINDAAGNTSDLTLFTPGAANSLGSNKALVIDTTDPIAPVVVTPVSTATIPQTYTFQGTCTTSDMISISHADITGSPVTVACVASTFSVAVPFASIGVKNNVQATSTDQAGNVSTNTTIATLTVTSANNVTINKKAGQEDPTDVATILYTVVFSQAIDTATFTTADINTSSSTTGGVTVNSVTEVAPNDDTTFEVSVTATGANGNVVLSIDAAAVQTLTLVDNAVSSSTDNIVGYDTTADAAPGTPDMEGTSDTGVLSTDSITSDTTPDFTLSCVTGSTVNLIGSVTGALGSAVCAASTATITATAMVSENVSATQTDPAGNVSAASGNLAVVIDTTTGTVFSVNSVTSAGSYKEADVISIQVNFSEVVQVTGTPQLTLETGATDAVVNYASGTGTSTLTFNYTIAAGETSSDLDYTGTTALALNGGTINDTAGNVVTLTLAAPGAANSLGANEAFVVDTTVPTVTNVTSSTSNGSYNAGDIISIQVVFSEVVNVTGTPQLTLETGATDAVVNYASGTGTTTLTFTYTIASGENAADLDYGATTSLQLNGGTIRDAALNNSNNLMAAPGAAGSLGANKAFVVDTTAPSAIVIGTISPSSPAFSNDTTPTISGTIGSAENTAIVTIKNGVTTLCTDSTAAGDGSWNCDTSVLTEGTYTLSAIQTDEAGNESTATSYTITIDTTAPSAPNLATISPVNSASTNDGTPTISAGAGSAEADATVSVYDGVTLLCSTTALIDGSWSCTSIALTDATYSITIRQTDRAGNTSTNSAYTLTIDGAAPGVSNVTSSTANAEYNAGDVISIQIVFTENVVVTGTPQLTLETGATDAVVNYASGTGTTTLTFTYTVASGENSIDLEYVNTTSLALNGGTIRDAGSNNATLTLPVVGGVGSLGNNKAIIVDTTAPVAVTLLTMTPANNGYTNDTTPTISSTGSTEANATVLVTNGTNSCTTTANGSGDWSCTISPAFATDGAKALTVTQTDTAGNVSVGATYTLNVDTSIPSALSTGGISPVNSSSTSDTTPTFSGSAGNAESGATIEVKQGVTTLCTTTAALDGSWSCNSTALADGSHPITITQTDSAGNISTGVNLTITVDTTAPTQPSISGANISPANNGATNDLTPTITGAIGSAEAGATISVDDGTYSCTAVVAIDGSWSCTISPALTSATTYNFLIEQTDTSGNVSTPAVAYTVITDTVAPSAISTGDVTPASGSPLNTTPVTLTGAIGSAESGAGIEVRESGTLVCSTTAAIDGSWSCNIGSPTEGSHSYTITQTDTAGNISSTLNHSITIDTVVPTQPSISGANISPANNGATNDLTPTITGAIGSAEAGATISVDDGTYSCTAVVAIDGSWSCTISPALTSATTYNFLIEQTDTSGNVSTPAVAYTVITDTVAPSALSLVDITPSSPASVSNSSTTITGSNAEAGSTVTIKESGTVVCTTTADISGNWTCGFTVSSGAHTYDIIQTDSASNESSSTTYSLTYTPASSGGGGGGGGGGSISPNSGDQCTNITGYQLAVPTGYSRTSSGTCILTSQSTTTQTTPTSSTPKISNSVAQAFDPKDTNHFTENLKLGSRGEEVRKLQIFLSEILKLPVRVTGTYNTETGNAVKEFQLMYPEILERVGEKTPTNNFFASSRQTANAIMVIYLKSGKIIIPERDTSETDTAVVEEESTTTVTETPTTSERITIDANATAEEAQAIAESAVEKSPFGRGVNMPVELRNHVFLVRLKQGSTEKAEVIKLQIFLNYYIGANLPTTGAFGPLTTNAVKVYQNLYRTILEKAEAGAPTGNFYQFSVEKANEILNEVRTKEGLPLKDISELTTLTPVVTAPIVVAQPTTSESVCAKPFTQNLKRGDSGAETTRLQEFLNLQGYNLEVAGTFGPTTEAAVKDFQLQYADEVLTPAGLTEPNGFWGQLSRNVADRLCTE
jgi:hypothetical protein